LTILERASNPRRAFLETRDELQLAAAGWAESFIEGFLFNSYAIFVSFQQVIDELPRMSFEQRQEVVRRALELDDSPLSDADEALIETRRAAHRADPQSSISVEAMKTRLRSRSKS
jgi:hypothetical protein